MLDAVTDTALQSGTQFLARPQEPGLGGSMFHSIADHAESSNLTQLGEGGGLQT